MYIAARRIQAHWRQYRIQKLLRQRQQAAITIQRWWRGFWMRSQQSLHMELLLQKTVLDHFQRAANTIQAFFRGWRDRRNVHDDNQLRRTQKDAVEELLHSLAVEMRRIKAAGFIAGTESLRDSRLLSKVERIIAMLGFRFHNARVLSLVARRTSYKEEQCRYFEGADFFFEVPFAGPNFFEMCSEGVTNDMRLVETDIDECYHDIIVGYETFQQNSKLRELLRAKALQKLQQLRNHVIEKERKKTRDFCEDVADHMSKWPIWQNIGPIDSKSEKFCDEMCQCFFRRMEYLLDEYNVSCYCKAQTELDIVPPKKNF
ncbi:hypothetical protein KR074_005966, partial [Drosophila pseudoananassae]